MPNAAAGSTIGFFSNPRLESITGFNGYLYATNHLSVVLFEVGLPLAIYIYLIARPGYIMCRCVCESDESQVAHN
jgi:hypothetical protein